VAGAIGPLGVRIEPYGPTGRDEAEAYFRRQVEGLLEGGVDGFVLETFSDLEEVLAAYRAVRSRCELPIIAQMTIGDDGRTLYGTEVETIAKTLDEAGADAIGLNCSVGPAIMLEAIERMARATARPIVAQPNAGLPRVVGDRRIYLSSPEYMANYARRMIAVGARFVGGCCGTTPEHIKQIADLVAPLRPKQAAATVAARAVATGSTGSEPVPLAERSGFGRKLAAGEFVTSVELLPPRGPLPAELVAQARALKQGRVDAVNILDGPRAQSRMGAIPAAIIIEREVGLETVIYYTCRDRNMLGMISDLLGAAAAGLRNILIITGDPPRTGPYPDATAVFDIDSIGLTNVVHRLNRGLDPGGNSLGAPTRYVIGVALNQAALDPERELARFAWKVEAGAEFAVTQPVFDPAQLEALLKQIERYRIPIIAGVWPLISQRNAEFLANEVPGLSVPEAVLKRMRRAQEQGDDAARAEGVAIAREMLAAVRGAVQGVQVTAPLGRVDVALEVLR